MGKTETGNFVETNLLYCGDNLKRLADFPEKCIDLIYLDPPFFSNRPYEIIWGDDWEIKAFDDRWKGGIENYLVWMEERVRAMYRVLKNTGSFYLHCDWHAGHYLKEMLDKIFGRKHFRNEIIWAYESGGRATHFFPRKHDTIFWYTKSDSYYFDWNKVGIPRNLCQSCQQILPKWNNLKRHVDKDGRVYRTIKSAGKIYKYYDDDPVPPTDVWVDISHIQQKDPQRTGYPTQKPEALLERIIKVSSKEDNVVLDPFCGCGTTLAVSAKFKRRWIGIDIAQPAIALVKNRLLKITREVKEVGMPKTEDDVRRMDPWHFQYWAVIDLFSGTPQRKMSGDMGIDGWTTFPRMGDFSTSQGMEHIPIQVKQSDGIGRNVIDNFETAIKRAKKNKGYVVAFSFGKGAHEEVARVKREDGLEIKLVTVEELLGRKT